MSTLNIENLGGSMRMGGEELLGSGASEARILKEMHAQGLAAGVNEPSKAGGANTFAEVFQKSMDKVNQHQVEADRAITELVAGRSKNIHETMLAVERADTSLKLMMQVRNKALEAYREIMRMQV